MDEYINRDKLRLMKVEECAGHTVEYADGWKSCIQWLKSLPKEDVRPVVRGKWEEHSSMIDSYKRCSKCGVVMPIAEIPSWLYYNLDYCPNCGADMREGGE